jgi:magnesium chelatase family protein
LVGGGSYPQPGEISLAHHGILFLDELTEFKRQTLEVLRQPLESKTVNISRALHSISFPAGFLLVAALNPCPCGYWGDKKKQCHCSSQNIARYLEKLSGPLLDRIDLQISVQSIEYDMIKDSSSTSTNSEQMYHTVNKAILAQQKRFSAAGKWNSTMSSDEIEAHCKVTADAEKIIRKTFDALHLSMRGYHKILKVARTIADLEEKEVIDVSHIQEAIMYRSLDQNLERHRQ